MSWNTLLEVFKNAPLVRPTGFPGSSYAFFLAAHSLEQGHLLCEMENEDSARNLVQDLRVVLPNQAQSLFFPAYDRLENELLPPGAMTVYERLLCLKALTNPSPCLSFITTREALDQPTLPKERFLQLSVDLKKGQEYDWDRLLGNLAMLGYSRVDMVASRGEFSVRGDIIDIFPSTESSPVRCEFFGEELESIKEFEIYTQRSQDEVDSIQVYCVQEFDSVLYKLIRPLSAEVEQYFQSRSEGFDLDYLVHQSIPGLEWLNPYVQSSEPVENYIKKWKKPLRKKLDFAMEGVPSFGKKMEWFIRSLEEKVEDDFQVLLFLPKQGFNQRIKALLKSRGCPVFQCSEPMKGIAKNPGVYLLSQPIQKGFEVPDLKVACYTYQDFTGISYQPRKKSSSRVYEGDVLHHFSELEVGDYVVHTDYGISKFEGIETIRIDGIRKEFLVLQFGGTDKVFVPITEVDRVHRFTPAEGKVPTLNRLHSVRWKQIKGKVKEEVQKFARDLLEQYAKRTVVDGFSFSKDTELLEEMEASFEHEETQDQMRAIEETKKSMQEQAPMDRLLCGDVGFGKTEIAIRAAFKAVQDKKQVAVLCPTTILAQQHFQTFQSRLMGYPVRVEVLNRFVGAKRAKEVLNDLAGGKVDILIGTHRMLSKDVKFASLGILIVDEEQRFGVSHKEKLRKLKVGVDTLTLSATPIPRTLNLALSGARSISVIHTPPPGRLPIKTFVLPYQQSTVKEAIEREFRRKGQVFYVYNRVETIEARANQLLKLIPGLRLRYLHGQMDAKTIEETMTAFLQKEFDVLLATTIIESGMDIPNVNTILVERADHFGLSQLYQLRGRIGRRDAQGYAYLFYKDSSTLTATARKRLMALEEFTQLGSGFKIAMRDLEIRGSGNLLGKQQSGFVYTVGFDLYTRLLRDAVEKLRDGNYHEERDMPQVELRASSYVDEKYIPSYNERMDFFRRVSNLKSIVALDDLKRELMDRYGGFSTDMSELLRVVELRVYGFWAGVQRFKQLPGELQIDFFDVVPLNLKKAFMSTYGSAASHESRFPNRLRLILPSQPPAKNLDRISEFFNQPNLEKLGLTEPS